VMLEQVGTACLRGAGDTISGLVARIVLNLVNAFLSTTLVAGFGLFPKLGFSGLAIGATAGHCVGGLIILFCLVRRGSRLRITERGDDSGNGPAHPQWVDWPTMHRILRIGVPGGIDVWAVLTC